MEQRQREPGSSWRRPQRGSKDARGAEPGGFAALVMLHLPAVLRVTAALVGTADAEDAAQESIVQAWQAAPTLRDEGALRAWLLQIAVNLCRDWHRGRFGTRQRLNESLHVSSDGEALALIGADPGTSDHTGAIDLRWAINTLHSDLRMVVALRYYAGMDASEIGAALGLPAATVRTRLRRALMVLRERLGAPSDLPAADAQEGGL
jgi:RNA polymerase sigma-70 factor (ECF subfamily)